MVEIEKPAEANGGSSVNDHAGLLITPEDNSATDITQADRDNLLAMLRVAAAKLALSRCELNFIGTALKTNRITPETAVAWLYDEELDEVVGLPERREAA